MTINYIARARKNREIALSTLKDNRRPILGQDGYPVYHKASRKAQVGVFITSRNANSFTPITLH